MVKWEVIEVMVMAEVILDLEVADLDMVNLEVAKMAEEEMVLVVWEREEVEEN